MVVLGVLLSVHANADENGVLIEGVYYNLVTASKTATVTNGSTAYTGAVTIPATVIWEDITYDVTSISMEAFKGCGGLTSVSIPGSVAKIGDQAFYNCTGLTSVTIPDGVTSIGNEAFRNCSNLATVVIGDDVKTIGYDAFYECKAMTALTLGKRVETIGDGAFYYCSKLSSITIPNSITNIGSNAFLYCNSLWSVNITNLQAWCKISFENDRANPLEGPRTQSQSAARLYLNGSEVKELVIPNNVTSIKPYAFTECQGLRAVTIPNSVTSIETSAFYSCDNLTTVNIEGNGTTIGNYVFYNCGNLTTLNITGNLTSIGANAFEGCGGLKKVDITDLSAWCKTAFSTLGAPLEYAHHLYLNGVEIIDLQIPNGTTTISAFAFSGCTALQSVSIPSSVKSIGYRAFYGCTGLASVKIPDSVTSLGNEAFSGCSNLTSATLGNGIPSIGNGTFNGCSSLSTVEFGTGITSIGEIAFNNCVGLTDVTLGRNVQSIVKRAFYGCKNMATVTIPGSVTSIGDYAFQDCSNLNTVNITDLAAWCRIAFGQYASPMQYASTITLNGETITDIVIPEGVSTINAYAFRQWNCLKSVVIGNDVMSINKNAFQSCQNLSSVTIGSSVTSIGDEAFRYCGSLQKLTIGNNVNSIGDKAFYNCGDLRSIVVVKGNNKYDSRDNCNAIIVTNTNTLILGCCNTVIPETVSTLRRGAFYGCTGLSYISIPKSITNYDYDNGGRWGSPSDRIFEGCNNLKELEIHSSNVPYPIFEGFESLEKVVLGSEVTSIGGSAFYGCTNMSTVISYIQEPFAFGSSAFNFDNVYNTCKLIVPAGTRDAYIAKGWTESVFKGGVVEADPNSFVVADQTVNRGATVTIPIELNNVTPVTAFQFEVNLPEGITWSRCTLTDRKDDHIISAKKQATGNYMVTAISLSDESFSGTSGAIAKLELKVDGQQIAGLYRLNIKNIGLTAEDGSELHPLDVSNTLAINDFTLGDTNGDGNVTITDAVMVVSHVLGNDPEGFVSNAADMNDSGDITITDAVAIIKIVLDGQKTHAAERRTGVMVLDPQ